MLSSIGGYNLAAGVVILFLLHRYVVYPLLLSPLSKVPGPKLYGLTKWRLALEDWRGTRTRKIQALHEKYGPAVRIGPNDVAFNSLSALKTIYGAGSGFERTAFYDMFDVYGKKNLFSFYSVKDHGERKKLLAHAYSKSAMLKGDVSRMIQQKVKEYLDLIDKSPEHESDIFTSLHYFSIDAITDFLYARWGRTRCLQGNAKDRELLNDIMHISRRRLSWFVVHLKPFTGWLYSRTGWVEKVVRHFYPMPKPTTFTGIRRHALQAWERFADEALNGKVSLNSEPSIIERLGEHHASQKSGGLDDLEVASEAADHLLAGIDTTSDSLMFLIWALSRPGNLKYQQALIKDVEAIPGTDLNEDGIPAPEACDRLEYLDAVIMETLRLYAPLPASEPRSYPVDTLIDGYLIPARTVVSMSPFSLHRAEAFKDPLVFNPERWLSCSPEEGAEMKRWFWAFSSGGRKCIGLHLAMAEMTTLVASIYRKYRTVLVEGNTWAPGITNRVEIFHDVSFEHEHVKEHECWIRFEER